MTAFGTRIGRVTIKSGYRRHAWSFGLDWPLVYGELFGPHCWAVWDRKTGVVAHIVSRTPNQHDWSDAKTAAAKLAEPTDYAEFNPFLLDSVP